MSFLRKLELICGILIAAMGLFIGLSYFRLDQQSSERLGREFPIYSTILIFSLLNLFPGILIFFGSYLHSVKRKQAGQFLLIIGSLVNVVIFLLFLFSPVPVPYGRLDLFWLSSLSAALAILASIISFFGAKTTLRT